MELKTGDVTGDDVLDTVYLYGQVDGPPSIFADNITLVIQDGPTYESTTVHLKNNEGYNARLFLGDFNNDTILDIMVSIDTGGSGGYGIFTIYSFRNNSLHELFNVDKYNKAYTFQVNYEDFYKVQVGSPRLNVLFTIDISSKGPDYLSQYYDDNGNLKNPLQGEVHALGALYPIITTNESYHFDLLALQRIIGPTNAGTLGYVENLLTWKDTQLVSNRLSASIPGTNLAVLYE
ncbi:VCBS repeat-containing protein [Sporosarcina sp. G11-34]|uniref:VCBS repeat-containing protein n=1 Tax=Sporosarcina sp. G11-34 TaxID=2849605 RepID=UPI0022A952C8|nr:VCBS repeat-containing protein [Sporosarcina sp. G11-34]